MDRLQPLLQKTLIVVAHPDDEVIGYGAIMQRMRDAVVVFCTDGAPRDDFFWKQYGSREAYAQIRRDEAHKALAIVGARPIFLADRISGGVVDQELFLNLPSAMDGLRKVVAEEHPDALLTLAYEGGHPDHDAACFLSAQIAKAEDLPVWEAALYYRDAQEQGVAQRFIVPNGDEIDIQVQGRALDNKIAMFNSYVSQKLVLDGFRPEVEQFRPLAEYDFGKPPAPWKLNYELWQWKMSGEEVAAAFADMMSASSGGKPKTVRTPKAV